MTYKSPTLDDLKGQYALLWLIKCTKH